MFKFSNNVRKLKLKIRQKIISETSSQEQRKRDKLKKIKEKALTTTNYVAITSTLQEIQNDVATQMNLSPQETIVKSLNRNKRKLANALPHIPHGKDFQITEEFKDFVAFDKGKDEPERFIIFALTEMLLMLESTKDVWLGDGTFKQCPDMFYQLYTIHITIGGYSPPCIYALLPNKTEKTYHDFTQALPRLIPNFGLSSRSSARMLYSVNSMPYRL